MQQSSIFCWGITQPRWSLLTNGMSFKLLLFDLIQLSAFNKSKINRNLIELRYNYY